MCFKDIKTVKEGHEPKGIDEAYQLYKKFDMKWRYKIGKVECDCKELLWRWEPWYGWSVFHHEECAVMKYYRKYPQRFNFVGGEPSLIAQSE